MPLALFEIPLTPRPQTFTATLRGVTYGWQLYWLVPAQCWVVNIADITGRPILSGIPLLPGSDLLGQFGHVGIGGGLVVYTDHAPEVVPDFTNLGVTGHLFWVNV